MFRRKTGMFMAVFSALMLLAPAASAQISPIIPGTITVTGEASASVPAEEATIVITIGADSAYYYEDPMTMQVEPLDTSAGDSVDVSNIIDAIIQFGIPVNDVTQIETPFMGEWGSDMGMQPASILVTVMQPSVDGLSSLLEVVRSAAHADGYFVNQFGVLYSVEDCRAVRQEARANAFENARQEAEDQAVVMDTTIGEVLASRDTLPMSAGYFQTNSCNTAVAAVPYSMTYMAGQFDPGVPPEVTVWVSVEVSFEIP